MLIRNPKRFLAKSKTIAIDCIALAGAAASIAGISYALMGGYSHLANSDEVKKVDFDKRPHVYVDFPGIAKTDFRIARHGEYQNPITSISEYSSFAFEDLRQIGDSSIRGFAAIAEKGTIYSDSDICVVSTRQSAKGNEFYNDKKGKIIYDKNLFDLFVQSHEAQHCFFRITTTGPYPEEGTLEHEYLSSLKEVSSDLAGILDYMRLTGDDQIYRNLVKPFRMAHPADIGHTTVAALDVILKDVNPQSLMAASADEIPTLVTGLMMKHLDIPEYGYETLGQSFKNDEHPAISALVGELYARVNLIKGKMDNPEVVAYREEIKKTLLDQFEAYEHRLPENVYMKVLGSQNSIFEKFDLHELEVEYYNPRTAEPSQPLADKGMLAHFTR